jgi:hypothetical protein
MATKGINQQFDIAVSKKLSNYSKTVLKKKAKLLTEIMIKYIIIRTQSGKTRQGRSFPKYDSKYAKYKRGVLSGKYKPKSFRKTTKYKAKKVSDKVQFSGKLMSSLSGRVLKVQPFSVFNSKKGFVTIELYIPKKFHGQAKGLEKMGYKWFGFAGKRLPQKLIKQMKRVI